MGYAGGDTPDLTSGYDISGGAGGGGAASVGLDGGTGAQTTNAGKGGDAKSSSITGLSTYYAAGGGGLAWNTGTLGVQAGPGTNATGAANSGDGGGGSVGTYGSAPGSGYQPASTGNGQSGIVIL